MTIDPHVIPGRACAFRLVSLACVLGFMMTACDYLRWFGGAAILASIGVACFLNYGRFEVQSILQELSPSKAQVDAVIAFYEREFAEFGTVSRCPEGNSHWWPAFPIVRSLRGSFQRQFLIKRTRTFVLNLSKKRSLASVRTRRNRT